MTGNCKMIKSETKVGFEHPRIYINFRKPKQVTMNQKNIFSAISVVLILQGIAFFVMKSQLASSAFPAVDATGQVALSQLIEVMGALSIFVGLVSWANRTNAGVVGAFTLGALVLLAVTMKHYFVDKINVPIPAMAIQVLIVFACAYLMFSKKPSSQLRMSN